MATQEKKNYVPEYHVKKCFCDQMQQESISL